MSSWHRLPSLLGLWPSQRRRQTHVRNGKQLKSISWCACLLEKRSLRPFPDQVPIAYTSETADTGCMFDQCVGKILVSSSTAQRGVDMSPRAARCTRGRSPDINGGASFMSSPNDGNHSPIKDVKSTTYDTCITAMMCKYSFMLFQKGVLSKKKKTTFVQCVILTTVKTYCWCAK